MIHFSILIKAMIKPNKYFAEGAADVSVVSGLSVAAIVSILVSLVNGFLISAPNVYFQVVMWIISPLLFTLVTGYIGAAIVGGARGRAIGLIGYSFGPLLVFGLLNVPFMLVTGEFLPQFYVTSGLSLFPISLTATGELHSLAISAISIVGFLWWAALSLCALKVANNKSLRQVLPGWIAGTALTIYLLCLIGSLFM